MDLRFAKYTELILQNLPHWFHLRKDSRDSLGARFLNVFGLSMDDVRYILDYAYQQCYLDTADVSQVDFCYKVIVPISYDLKDFVRISSFGTVLRRAKTLKEFFGIDPRCASYRRLDPDLYFMDVKRNILYVRNRYNVDALCEYGQITMQEKDKEPITFPLQPHPVWNFFDEFGALLDCPRNPEEPNIQYKKRLYSVFAFPAGSHKDGLINGISRELNLRRIIPWEDTTKDLILTDPMIVLNSIFVDGKKYDVSDVRLNSLGQVVLSGIAKQQHSIVSYVHGLEFHELFNQEDQKMQSELFTASGDATRRLQYYIDAINQVAPIFWNEFRWNEQSWDMNEANVSGYGYVANHTDASIAGFQTYRRG